MINHYNLAIGRPYKADTDLARHALENITTRLNFFDPSGRFNPEDPGIHPADPDPEQSAADDILPFFKSLGINTICGKEISDRNVVFTTGITGGYADMVEILAERSQFRQWCRKPVFIMPVPSYFHYINIPKHSGFEVVFLTRETDGSIDLRKLEQLIVSVNAISGSFVSCYYNSNPSAPMGHIRGVAETEALVKIFKKYTDIFLIDDFVDWGLEHINKIPQSFIMYPELSERAALLMGVSKSLGLPKLRAGMALAPENIAHSIANKISQRMDIPNGLSTEVMRLAFTDSEHFKHFTSLANAENALSLKLMKSLLFGAENVEFTNQKEKDKISEIVVTCLNGDIKRAREWLGTGIDGVSPVIEPEAGIFYLLDFSAWKGKYIAGSGGQTWKLIENEKDIASLLLRYGLKLMMGGETGGFKPEEMVMRATFSHSPETIVGAMARLRQVRGVVGNTPQEAVTAYRRDEAQTTAPKPWLFDASSRVEDGAEGSGPLNANALVGQRV